MTSVRTSAGDVSHRLGRSCLRVYAPVWPFAAAICRGPLPLCGSFTVRKSSLKLVFSRVQQPFTISISSFQSPIRAKYKRSSISSSVSCGGILNNLVNVAENYCVGFQSKLFVIAIGILVTLSGYGWTIYHATELYFQHCD